MSQAQLRARQIAHRLINPHLSRRAGSDTAAWAAATACDGLYRDLSRWVGPDGCHALFTRAHAQTRTEHPALGQIRLRARSEAYTDGVAEALLEHGDAATAEALKSMLVRLVELLGRLIGDDMAVKLIEQSLGVSERRDATFDVKQGET